ncbi:GIY-YIG nuclease family protein [uncultured Clostridium sp.]|uniref:GIY-YIG nuclease family protein n=1 Tax=uncultured Clostridium sp. TaxID=59620 RepID=UPI0025F58FE7|nr:GIY-YIG nuclease family protein [uncultured Clostridium sp.]
MNYVYIVECSDGTLYTGWTNNLERRVKQHSNGSGAKYTRGRGPVKLVYYEEYDEKTDAMKREYEIKRYSRKDKLKMIGTMQTLA